MAEDIEMIKDNNSNKAASSNDGAKQQDRTRSDTWPVRAAL